MTDLDRINARLDAIEMMLRQLLDRQAGASRPAHQAADIMTEIAQVKAAGGNLTEYFKAKAKGEQQRERRRKC